MRHWLDKCPKCFTQSGMLYSFVSLSCPSLAVPNIKSSSSVLGQTLFSPSLVGTEDTVELALMASGSGNDETALDIKLQRSLKHCLFHTIHFTWVLWLLHSYTDMREAQQSRGYFPGYQRTNFQLFHCYKVFKHSLITVDHTSSVWRLLRQNWQSIMLFFKYSSTEHISLTESSEMFSGFILLRAIFYFDQSSQGCMNILYALGILV